MRHPSIAMPLFTARCQSTEHTACNQVVQPLAWWYPHVNVCMPRKPIVVFAQNSPLVKHRCRPPLVPQMTVIRGRPAAHPDVFVTPHSTAQDGSTELVRDMAHTNTHTYLCSWVSLRHTNANSFTDTHAHCTTATSHNSPSLLYSRARVVTPGLIFYGTKQAQPSGP